MAYILFVIGVGVYFIGAVFVALMVVPEDDTLKFSEGERNGLILMWPIIIPLLMLLAILSPVKHGFKLCGRAIWRFFTNEEL